jgi:hypothetical protein
VIFDQRSVSELFSLSNSFLLKEGKVAGLTGLSVKIGGTLQLKLKINRNTVKNL